MVDIVALHAMDPFAGKLIGSVSWSSVSHPWPPFGPLYC